MALLGTFLLGSSLLGPGSTSSTYAGESTVPPPTTVGELTIDPGTRTGSFAVTQQGNTSQISGVVSGSIRTGSFVRTQAAQIFVAQGHVTQLGGTITGRFANTQDPQRATFTGTVSQAGGTITPHPGLRSVSNATLLAAAAPNNEPLVFVDIQWPTFSTKLCSYSTLDWAGNTWGGAGISVALDDNGYAIQLNLNDATNALRTLAQTYGMRDRVVLIWLAYKAALAPSDPILLPTAFGDSVDYTTGKLVVRLGKSVSNKTTTPRERVGPAVGINYLAPDGYSFHWGNTLVTINSRS